MAARFTALLPRLLALTVIWLLGAATFTLAAEKKSPAPPGSDGAVAAPPEVIVVPDVRGKAYVFAKGILQDAGFAWRVGGSVQGYAANSVASQNPAPGTRLVDNGAPTIVLRLLKNSTYGERGLPENDAPYAGTKPLSLSDWRRLHPTATDTGTAPTTTAPTTTDATTVPTTTAATTTNESPAPKPPKQRKPDFVIPGVPAEPADEMPLPARARMLERRMNGAAKPTRQLVHFWLYQHAWIVTGARFGWRDGADALRILIRVDKSLERRFDFGARSEAVARRALAYVEAKSK